MFAFSAKTATVLLLCLCFCNSSTAEEVTCMDHYPECPDWVQAGECENNKDSMDTNCPLSCGICSTTCYDRFSDCPTWKADGECGKNPAGMNDYCALSCGACSVDKCHDLYAECPTWQQDGECEKNPEGMNSYCMKSCGTCGQKVPVAKATAATGKRNGKVKGLFGRRGQGGIVHVAQGGGQGKRQGRSHTEAQWRQRKQEADYNNRRATGVARAAVARLASPAAKTASAFGVQDFVKLCAGVLAVLVLVYLAYYQRQRLAAGLRKGMALELSAVSIPGLEVPTFPSESDKKSDDLPALQIRGIMEEAAEAEEAEIALGEGNVNLTKRGKVEEIDENML